MMETLITNIAAQYQQVLPIIHRQVGIIVHAHPMSNGREC